jgi:transcription antitermination factor NusG
VAQWLKGGAGSAAFYRLSLRPLQRIERVKVLEVPGVLAIVGGTAGEMAPLSDEAIETLQSGLHLRNAEPHPLLTVGQRARIRSGALAGME